MVSDSWFIIYGVWFVVYGSWFVVYGLWFLVDGVPADVSKSRVLGFGV
jgi:hypothetical protein